MWMVAAVRLREQRSSAFELLADELAAAESGAYGHDNGQGWLSQRPWMAIAIVNWWPPAIGFGWQATGVHTISHCHNASHRSPARQFALEFGQDAEDVEVSLPWAVAVSILPARGTEPTLFSIRSSVSEHRTDTRMLCRRVSFR